MGRPGVGHPHLLLTGFGERQARRQEAAAHLAAGAAEGLPPQLVAEQQKALNHLSTAYLRGLDHAELAALAAEEGFCHPTLVGLNTAAGGAHPLVH